MKYLKVFLILIIAILYATDLCLFFYTPTIPVKAPSDSLIPIINEHRSNKLQENTLLDLSATKKACDMVKNNYWSHTDKDGNMSWQLFINAGYQYRNAGEIMARNFTADREIITYWLNSKAHKQVMLNDIYNEVGVGRCKNVVVVHLGKL